MSKWNPPHYVKLCRRGGCTRNGIVLKKGEIISINPDEKFDKNPNSCSNGIYFLSQEEKSIEINPIMTSDRAQV